MDQKTADRLMLAFPFRRHEDTGQSYDCPGMTLRDYFAGQALAGIEAKIVEENLTRGQLQQIARNCYMLADFMMEARNG